MLSNSLRLETIGSTQMKQNHDTGCKIDLLQFDILITYFSNICFVNIFPSLPVFKERQM
jgi:hypothetical protein